MSHSKQLNFFIMPQDWEAINNFFKEEHLLFIKIPIKTKEQLFEDDISIKGEESYQVYLTTNEYKDKIVIQKQNAGFDVDILRSYCIEFSRGGFFPYSDKILHRARFYSITQYFDDDNIIQKKENNFPVWIDHIYEVFKRRFLIKTKSSSFLFSERTIEWVSKNNAEIDKAGLTIINSEKSPAEQNK